MLQETLQVRRFEVTVTVRLAISGTYNCGEAAGLAADGVLRGIKGSDAVKNARIAELTVKERS